MRFYSTFNIKIKKKKPSRLHKQRDISVYKIIIL